MTHFELIFVPSVRHVEESFFSLLRASHSWVILLIHSTSLHLLIDVSGLLTFSVLTVMSGLQVFFPPFGCLAAGMWLLFQSFLSYWASLFLVLWLEE